MKTKTFLLCWLLSLAVGLILNGLFHGQLAASFFDSQLGHLHPAIHKMSDSDPRWLVLLELVLTFSIIYFITLRACTKIKLSSAAFSGGLLTLVAAGTWNFANASMFTWPTTVILVDILWHIFVGVLTGALVGAIYNRKQNPPKMAPMQKKEAKSTSTFSTAN